MPDSHRWRWAPAAVVLVALVVRYGEWLRHDAPILGGDSPRYLGFAQSLARGDFSEFVRWPFYILYPLSLTPMYTFSLSPSTYIQCVHLAASTLTVFLLYRIGRSLVSSSFGLLVAAAAAVYPSFLFWLPYILTETLFFFCLAAYVYAYLRLMDRQQPATALLYGIACVLLALSRPSAVPCLGFSWLVMAAYFAGRRWGIAKGLALVAAVGVIVVVAGAGLVVSSEAVQNRILSMPTIGQTLWASTQYSTGNLRELKRVGQLDQEMHARFAGVDAERREYAFKIQQSADFIRTHPGRYAVIVGHKLVAYWFPWAFADTWSPSHRVLDATVSIALSIGFLLSFTRRPLDGWRWTALTAMATSFALLSAFGQVDPDARYRVPAELIVLVLAAAGYAALWTPHSRRTS
jgi:4-amino-4-deoxy-L-arabinose transferase-like glycosyltransferase